MSYSFVATKLLAIRRASFPNSDDWNMLCGWIKVPVGALCSSADLSVLLDSLEIPVPFFVVSRGEGTVERVDVTGVSRRRCLDAAYSVLWGAPAPSIQGCRYKPQKDKAHHM